MAIRLLAFGSNGAGQLGIGHCDDVSTPQPCLGLENEADPATVSALAAGGNHTLLLLSSGHLYGAGSSAQRQTGLADGTTTFRVINRSSNNRIKFIAATWEASIIVTDDDEVSTSGFGPKGELGQGTDIDTSSGFSALDDFLPSDSSIVDVAACMSHAVVVASDGHVFGWGNGRKGQLGPPTEIVWTPRKIPISFPAEAAVCGRDFTCIAANPQDGRIAVLGSEKFSIIESAPSLIKDWTSIEAGWCSMHALMQGSVISWGRQDHGQMLGSSTKQVRMIAAGSEHVLAKQEDNRVLAWGWGEHGNCGPDFAETSTHQIPVQGEVTFLGAGCATSFICVTPNAG